MEKLSALSLRPGDVVVFRRGGRFRGVFTAASRVTYSAYGEGPKPVLCGSLQNYAQPELWQETEYENVYLCAQKLDNVGIVALNHTGELGKYHEQLATRMVAGVDGFSGPEDLSVWSDLNTGKLYFCSKSGNPGLRFDSIEIGVCANPILVPMGITHVTIDNLYFTLTGAHGVGSFTTKNLTVRNCLFNWIGGSILRGFGDSDTIGYGNAVEIYGGCDGYRVSNNWIYQIYDTGITHQFNNKDIAVNHMENIEYDRNLIEYCFWSIEYYNTCGEESVTRQVWVHDNFCRFGGYGWGCRGRETNAPMYSMGRAATLTEDYVTENNIFDRSLGSLLCSYPPVPEKEVVFRNNTYVQPYGKTFAQLNGEVHYYDEKVGSLLLEYFGESRPNLVCIL